VIDRGWHTEIGVPADELQGPLAWFRTVYPGARVVIFGYGKRTFILSPARGLAEYVLGPFPGPAVVQTMGIKVTPLEAWGAHDVVALPITAKGVNALNAAIAADLPTGRDGHPTLVAKKFGGASLFYVARSAYGPVHTCNSWSASLLKAAGLDVSDWPIAFAGQVMGQARALSGARCRAPAPSADVPGPLSAY